jgi:hypothetical protein
MSEVSYNDNDIEIKNTKRWPFIILIGCLSMFLAEVFAGSSQIWFIDPWSLLVTFPLYLGHLLLFLNLAMRTKKTSIPQLYFWGVLFGLYESWITKVLWFGYPGSEGAAFGLVGGIAILEFFTLVFFWHPILAFIMPILIYESFALSNDRNIEIEKTIFMSHLPFLNKKNKKFFYFCIFLGLAGSALLSLNSGYNILVVANAILGSIGLIFLFFKLSMRYNTTNFSIYTLKLGTKEFLVVIIYIILLYLVTFFFLLPERIPTTILPIAIIIGFYAFIFVVLKMTNQIDEKIIKKATNIDIYDAQFFFKFFGLFLALSILYCLIPIIGIIIAFLIFLSLFMIGPIIFLLVLIKTLKK